MSMVDCPRCTGGEILDLRKCGRNCLLSSPSMRKCGFCNGRGYISEEDLAEYDESIDYEWKAEIAKEEWLVETMEDSERRVR